MAALGLVPLTGGGRARGRNDLVLVQWVGRVAAQPLVWCRKVLLVVQRDVVTRAVRLVVYASRLRLFRLNVVIVVSFDVSCT